MRKVSTTEVSPMGVTPAELHRVHYLPGKPVYARIVCVLPNDDADEDAYASDSTIPQAGDIVMIGVFGGDDDGLVIWLSDGDFLPFDRANVELRVVPIGINETITLS